MTDQNQNPKRDYKREELIDWIAEKLAANYTDVKIRQALVEEFSADELPPTDEVFDELLRLGHEEILQRSKLTTEEAAALSKERWKRLGVDPKASRKEQMRAQENLDKLTSVAGSTNPADDEEYQQKAALFEFAADNTIEGITQEESEEILAKRKAEGHKPESGNPFIATPEQIQEAKKNRWQSPAAKEAAKRRKERQEQKDKEQDTAPDGAPEIIEP